MNIPSPRFEPAKVNFSGLSFIDRVRYIRNNPPRFRLVEDWIVTLDDGLPLIFPKGFVTDFASIPRALWWVPGFSPTGPLIYGSIPHDFGYQYGYLLTPYDKSIRYGEASMALYEQHNFGEWMPVYVGYPQEFFDNLLSGMTIEATGAKFVAESAKIALGCFGDNVWDKYRTIGPTAFNENSLGLPGITKSWARY